MSTKEKIGKRIREKREEKGWSLSKLADETEALSKSRISNYEHGRRTPGPDEAIALARALKCTPAYILCLDDGNNQAPVNLKYTEQPSVSEPDSSYKIETESDLFELIDIYKKLPPEYRKQVIESAEKIAGAHGLNEFKKSKLESRKKTG